MWCTQQQEKPLCSRVAGGDLHGLIPRIDLWSQTRWPRWYVPKNKRRYPPPSLAQTNTIDRCTNAFRYDFGFQSLSCRIKFGRILNRLRCKPCLKLHTSVGRLRYSSTLIGRHLPIECTPEYWAYTHSHTQIGRYQVWTWVWGTTKSHTRTHTRTPLFVSRSWAFLVFYIWWMCVFFNDLL